MSGRRALGVGVACGLLLAVSAAATPAQSRQAAVRPKVNHPGFAAMHFPPQAGLMQQQQLQYLMLQRNNPALTGLRAPMTAGLQTAAMTRPAGRCGPTAPTSNTSLTTMVLANPKPFLKPSPSFVPKPFLTPVAFQTPAGQPKPFLHPTPSGQPKPFPSPTPSVSGQPKPPCSHPWPVQTQPQFVTVIVQNSQPCGCIHPKPFGTPFNFTLLTPFSVQPPNLTMSFPVV